MFMASHTLSPYLAVLTLAYPHTSYHSNRSYAIRLQPHTHTLSSLLLFQFKLKRLTTNTFTLGLYDVPITYNLLAHHAPVTYHIHVTDKLSVSSHLLTPPHTSSHHKYHRQLPQQTSPRIVYHRCLPHNPTHISISLHQPPHQISFAFTFGGTTLTPQ